MQRIGRYEIQEEIATGGMGVVYQARDPLMKRRVALKLLRASLQGNVEIRARFEREAEAIAALEHPSIVPIYDFGEHEGQLYFVMRFLDGGTLEKRFDEKPASDHKGVAAALENVAKALDTAHRAGLVHRDVKPANILFDASGDAFLSDFGIAKVVESEVQETGTLMLGTPRYMSPEQAHGETEVGPPSDLYSLAVVAYQGLCGRAPFAARNALAMAYAHVHKRAPAITKLNPALPKVADKVFARALAKNPEARYRSAGEFARDLYDLTHGRWYLISISDDFGDPATYGTEGLDDEIILQVEPKPGDTVDGALAMDETVMMDDTRMVIGDADDKE